MTRVRDMVGKEAECTCSMEPGSSDEIRASVRSSTKTTTNERTNL